MKALAYFFTLIFFLVLSIALTQEGLYDPAPPADSAFVRVIQADGDLSAAETSIGDINYGSLDYLTISPYQVVPQGTYEGTFGDLTASLEVAAGNFYTVAVAQGKAILLQDPVNGNLTKTLLVLYNLSELSSADMKTADGATAVVSEVATETVDSILVNPIEVDLAAFAANQSIETFNGLSLKAGATYSMVIAGQSTNPVATWAASTVVR